MNSSFDDIALTLENDRDFYVSWHRASAGYKYRVIRLFAQKLCHLNIPEAELGSYKQYFLDRYAEDQTRSARSEPTQEPLISEIPQEIPMFFVNKSFLNGVQIDTLKNSDIYNAIAAKEANIATLEQIANKPKSLIKEIEQGKEEIKALVAYLDSKE